MFVSQDSAPPFGCVLMFCDALSNAFQGRINSVVLVVVKHCSNPIKLLSFSIYFVHLIMVFIMLKGDLKVFHHVRGIFLVHGEHIAPSFFTVTGEVAVSVTFLQPFFGLTPCDGIMVAVVVFHHFVFVNHNCLDNRAVLQVKDTIHFILHWVALTLNQPNYEASANYNLLSCCSYCLLIIKS